MWKLDSTEDIVKSHGIWFREVGNVGTRGLVRPGHVIVTSAGDAREVGYWGSANALRVVAEGAVGIVTDGCCRDTYELALQKTPICARARGRRSSPAASRRLRCRRPSDCGGVQVRPGDLIGCDDDGVIVVPAEVAAEVATHARAVLRRGHEGAPSALRAPRYGAGRDGRRGAR